MVLIVIQPVAVIEKIKQASTKISMNHLTLISIISIAIGLVSFVIIVVDILSGNRQPMAVMNIVYPLSALYAGPLALIFYYRIGKKAVKIDMSKSHQHMKEANKPFWQSVAIGRSALRKRLYFGRYNRRIIFIVGPCDHFWQ